MPASYGDSPTALAGRDGSPAGCPDGARLRALVVAVSARPGGGESYLSSQIEALAAIDELELTIWASDEVAQALAARVAVRVDSLPRRGVLRRLAWEQLVVPVRARGYDVVYLTGNFALFARHRPQVVALQNAYHFGAGGRWARRHLGSRRFRARTAIEAWAARQSVKHATAVVAVSESLASAVHEDLGSVDGLEVVRCAPPSKFNGLAEARFADERRPPYVLAVAEDYPHKDWDGLIATFLVHRDLPRLVLVGACRSPRRLRALGARIDRAGGPGRVELMGAIHDPVELQRLYRGARCCVAHSHLESFGFTPCEAMMLGVPLVASDLAAHREVCGRDAHYYDARSPEALAGAVRTAVSAPRRPSDPPVLRRTWQQNASELMALLRSAAGQPARLRAER